MLISLFKNKRFRIQSDVFCTEVRMRYDMLNTTAPVIPDYIQIRESRKLDNIENVQLQNSGIILES